MQQQFFAFKIKNFISPTLALNAAPHGIIVAQLIANTNTAHMPACRRSDAGDAVASNGLPVNVIDAFRIPLVRGSTGCAKVAAQTRRGLVALATGLCEMRTR